MRTHHKALTALAALASAAVAVVACGGAQGRGQLAVAMVDAPNPVVDEIWVNVERVTAHSVPGGWQTVSTFGSTPLAVDLLKLQTQAVDLGLATLPTGTVTEIRLVVSADGNYVMTGGAKVPLKVPSGAQSGIKIKGPWEIASCNKTAITIDFDGKNSLFVHPTDQGDEWILRPVIRIKKEEHVAITCPADPGADGGADAGSEPTPPPPPAGAGVSCAVAADCLSTVCYQQRCSPGGAGVPCAAAADCVSGTCTADGTCAAGTAGRSGATCSMPMQCMSNSCTSGTCDPGVQGATCSDSTDCYTGYTCMAGVCAAPAL